MGNSINVQRVKLLAELEELTKQHSDDVRILELAAHALKSMLEGTYKGRRVTQTELEGMIVDYAMKVSNASAKIKDLKLQISKL